MAYQPQNKPGKIGHITTVIYQGKNIGIDGKIYQLIDARVDRVRQDNPQLGDEVEYKISSSKDLSEKGKISFFAIKKRAGETPQPVTMTNPAPEEEKKPEPPATRIVQGDYRTHNAQRVTLMDCKGYEESWLADLDVLKFLSKPDCVVKTGYKVKALLIQQKEGEWVMSKIGAADPNLEDKPFRTGSEILEQNLKEKQEETAKAEAALAQINKENAEADARIAENQEYLKTLTGDQKPMSAPEPTKEPEKCQTEATVTVPDTSGTTDPIKDMPVELKVHLDCGSYSNFDMTVPGLPIDQAIAKVEGDAKKAIAMMHRLMAEAKKGY